MNQHSNLDCTPLTMEALDRAIESLHDPVLSIQPQGTVCLVLDAVRLITDHPGIGHYIAGRYVDDRICWGMPEVVIEWLRDRGLVSLAMIYGSAPNAIPIMSY